MASENIPTVDTKLSLWMTQFAAVATVDPAEYGLTTDQADALAAAASDYRSRLVETRAAMNAARKATAAKNDARQHALDLFRSYGKSILTDPDVEPGAKAKLGMKVERSSPKPVVPPKDLSATGFSNHTVKLHWSRGENSKHVSFVIEAKVGGSKEWRVIGMTNRVRYTDKNRTPGIQVTYRVIAFRGEKRSGASNLTVVYSGLGIETLPLRQAA